MADLEPVGIFVPRSDGGSRITVDRAAPLKRGLDSELRAPVEAYLRAGAVLFAIMEHTTEVLDRRFAVSGGLAVLSGGAYYGAADYVETYGLALPEPVVKYMRSRNWRPSVFAGEAYDELYQRLLSALAQTRSGDRRPHLEHPQRP